MNTYIPISLISVYIVSYMYMYTYIYIYMQFVLWKHLTRYNQCVRSFSLEYLESENRLENWWNHSNNVRWIGSSIGLSSGPIWANWGNQCWEQFACVWRIDYSRVVTIAELVQGLTNFLREFSDEFWALVFYSRNSYLQNQSETK